MYEWTKYREHGGIELGSTAADWFEKLRTLGVDVDKFFPETAKLIEHAESLLSARPPATIDIDALKRELTAELGRGTITVEEIGTRLADASRWASVKEDARAVIARAQDVAYNLVTASMRLPDANLVAILRPILAARVEAFTMAMDGVPESVHSEKDLRGRAQQRAWLSAAEALDQIDAVHALADAWRMNRLLSVEGKDGETNYHPQDFRWADVESMDSPMYRGTIGTEYEAQVSWFRRMLPHQPTILTIEEVDAYRARRTTSAQLEPVA